MQRFLIGILLIAACAVQLRAQTPPAPNIVKQEELAVRVTFENEHPVGPNVRVELLSVYGSTVQIGATDTSGMVRFTALNPAKYKLRIAGDGIVTTQTGEIDMTDSGPRVNQSVQVRRALPAIDAIPRATVDVNIPPDARKEFDKASDKMQHEDWNSAETCLERAIAIYPKYALAHNNLALVYVHLNQGQKAVESFRTAAQLDEHLQPANLYLGQFYYDNKDFKQAEPYLLRAASADPRNAQILLAVANSQMKNGEPDLALANAQKVHSLPDHKKFAIAHLIAAQVLTDRGENQRALEEYRFFLREDPGSPLAARVKDALAKLETDSK
jgi:tetratricopeptide (TPR) repeat protein